MDPYKKGKFGHSPTGRTSCEQKGKDCADVRTKRRTPKIATNHQKLREKQETDSLSPPKE